MYCSYCGKQIVRNLTMKELLFPFCLPKNELCMDCKQKFHLIHPGCATCQKEGITGICSECKRWQSLYPGYDFKQVALFKYDEGFADWIENYKYLVEAGLHRQDARGVLPLDTATICIYTYSIKEWRHILDLRYYGTTGEPHPNAKIIAGINGIVF